MKIASASSPAEERESATHMLTVVGSTLITSMPSRSAGASQPAAESALHVRSMPRGMRRRLNDWINPWSRTLAAARASSLVGRLSPASKNCARE